MINSPELRPIEEQIVRLGEEFTLFTPERRVNLLNASPMSVFILRTDLLPDLPLEAFGLPIQDTVELKKELFAPFNPEAGYIVTGEDLDFVQRSEKIKNMPNTKADLSKTPLKLIIQSKSVVPGNTDDSEVQGILDILNIGENGEIHGFKPEAGKIVKKLRLILKFPNGSYIGKNSEFDEAIYFDSFEPTNFLLAYNENASDPLLRESSLSIGIPVDPTLLQQIKGMFILTEDSEEIPEAIRKAFE